MEVVWAGLVVDEDIFGRFGRFEVLRCYIVEFGRFQKDGVEVIS